VEPRPRSTSRSLRRPRVDDHDEDEMRMLLGYGVDEIKLPA
jgi:hypothetical protein